MNWAKLLSLAEFIYNNFTHASADVSLFYLMYEYNSKIHYKVENNFIKEEISSAKERVKQFYDNSNQLIQRLQRVSKQQIKYYNIIYQLKSYTMSNLMLLSTKNLKKAIQQETVA